MGDSAEIGIETSETTDRNHALTPGRSQEIDRITPTLRPADKPIGFHRWSDLIFLHWRLPAEQIRPLLPERLTLDTFDGFAWVGLVPFKMRNIRPWWSCPVPGISNFYETNVRTYVHLDGRDPGVWFFSLDASSTLAVKVARWRWKLAYYKAAMQSSFRGNRLYYESHRSRIDSSQGSSKVEVNLPDIDPETTLHPAEPGTLEHFLVERYYLYSHDPDTNRMWKGQVHHKPYRFCPVELIKCDQSLLAAGGIDVQEEPINAFYSPGVDVDIHPLRLC